MKSMRSLVLVVALVACSGSTPKGPDAGLPACTMAIYDKCNTEHDCMSGMCQPFQMGAFNACTMACTQGGTPCPADPSNGGMPGMCTAMGFCKPSAPTMCHL